MATFIYGSHIVTKTKRDDINTGPGFPTPDEHYIITNPAFPSPDEDYIITNPAFPDPSTLITIAKGGSFPSADSNSASLTGGISTSINNSNFATNNTNSFIASIDSLRCECEEGEVWSAIQKACIEDTCDEHYLFNTYTDECDCDSASFNCQDPTPEFDPENCTCIAVTPTPTPTPTTTPTATATPTGTPPATSTPTSSYTTPSGQWYKELP